MTELKSGTKMSMNIDICAEREITYKINGVTKTEIQEKNFVTWQTPTLVTYDIIAQSNPLQAYIDWVLGRRDVQKVPVYANDDDDVFGLEEPIGFEDYCAADEHIQELKSWLEEMEHDGYTVLVEMI